MRKKEKKSELEKLIYDILNIIDCYSKIDNIYEESFGICPLHDIMERVGSKIEEYADNKSYKTSESLYENVKYFDHRLCDIDSKLIFTQEENKKLKEDNKRYKEWAETWQQLVEKLTSENKKLKEELDKYKKQYEHSMWEDDELIYEEWLYD